MLLVIDVGNTNMKYGLYDGKMLKARFRLSTNETRTADELGFLWCQFFAQSGYRPADVDAICISSVVPQVMYTLLHAIRTYLPAQPLIVGETLPLCLVNLCEEPLGADRAVTGIGAVARYGAPLVVVDFGTATKVDAFNQDGAYLGGMIAPGVKISMDALFAKAARLPRIEIKKPRRAIGINTIEQMQAGAIYGYVGALECMVAHTIAEMTAIPGGIVNGVAPPVVATGGLGRLIAEHTPVITHTDSDLTLEGLRIAYEQR